jgi:hypothetical protein
MKRPTGQQRGEIAARVFRELTRLHPSLDAAPDILGPAYGATMCDRAANARRAFDHLLIGLEDAMPNAMWKVADTTWKGHIVRPHTARAELRAQAGEPPLAEDAIRCTARGFNFPLLSGAEHKCLGADLKAVAAALTRAECDLANAYGARDNLRRRAAKAIRLLLQLRCHMDSIIHREHPAGIERRPAAAVYFGAEGGDGGHGGHVLAVL